MTIKSNYQALSQKAKDSITDAIREEPDRFVQQDPSYLNYYNIDGFGDFQRQIQDLFPALSEEDIIWLWETDSTKENVKTYIPEKYEEFFGDGEKVVYQAVTPKKAVIIRGEKVKVHSYKTKAGKEKRSYEKIKNRVWKGGEMNFIKVRKQKGVSKSQTIKEFNLHYKDKPRTESSIGSKYYRT